MTAELPPPNRKREQRLARAMRLTTLVPLPIDRPCPVLKRPLVDVDPRPEATGAETCPHCGTRLIHGCVHFRPRGDVG